MRGQPRPALSGVRPSVSEQVTDLDLVEAVQKLLRERSLAEANR